MLFFIDESGYEDSDTPYRVLAGISISEHDLGNFLMDYADLKRKILRWTEKMLDNPKKEIHARDFLSRRDFKWSVLRKPLPINRRNLSIDNHFLVLGSRIATDDEKAAVGQAHIEFLRQIIELLNSYDCVVFASVVDNSAPEQGDPNYLRKDYSYLFERFAEYIRCDCKQNEIGLVVHDSEDRKSSAKLIRQMREYFSATGKGRDRAKYLCPFPFFAESHLTPFVEISDLAAYCINWGFRSGPINAPTRQELKEFGKGFANLQFHFETTR